MDARQLLEVFKNGPAVTLHFACNDPDSGNWVGKAGAVEVAFGGDLYDRLSFSNRFFGWEPALSVNWDAKWLRMGGSFRIPFTQHGSHVGNWCWDCFKVKREDAAHLLVWPKFNKWFSLDEGPSEVFDLFKN